MVAAANSGWWFTESPHSMASIGWMLGTTWLTLPMSVLPPISPLVSGSGRPRASELAAYTSAMTRLETRSEYGLPIGLRSHVQPVA